MVAFFSVVFALFLLLTVVTRKYENDYIKSLPAKEHPLIFMYPTILFVSAELERIRSKGRNRLNCKKYKAVDASKAVDTSKNVDKKKIVQANKGVEVRENHLIKLNDFSFDLTVKENLKGIYIGNDLESTYKIYQLKKWSLALFLFLLFDVFALLGAVEAKSNNLIAGKYLERPAAQAEDLNINLTAVLKDIGGKIFQKEMEVPVSKASYSEVEAEEEFRKAIEYLDKVTLGENTLADKVYTSLVLPDKIPNSHVKASWTTSNTKLLEETGKIHNENIENQIIVQVTALLTLEERSSLYTRAYVICPKVYTEEEMAIRELESKLKKADEDNRNEPSITLPEKVKEYKITWLEKENSEGIKLFLLGVAVAFLSIPLTNIEISSKAEKRKNELLLDYPEIINKFMMLINAGMSVSNAWKKLAADYKMKGSVKRYAYEELALTAKELQMGISESKAYEEFGRRVKLVPYLRFVALLSQNIQKGSPDFMSKLEEESLKAFEERKERAKKAGEEAGTKLLVPMMIMLVMVIIIILIPAMASFQL